MQDSTITGHLLPGQVARCAAYLTDVESGTTLLSPDERTVWERLITSRARLICLS